VPASYSDLADPAVAAFVVIPAVLVIALISGARLAWRRSGAPAATVTRVSWLTGGLAVLWMAVTWVVADSGVLRLWDRRPPPFGLLMLAIAAISVAIAFSPFGTRLARFVPLWALVGVQTFRLPLELAMHAMYERGVMPPQMTYTGRNFDIVTGATAIVVAALSFSGRGGRVLVGAWNVMGLSLLVNVVVVAILSTPTFRIFGDERLNVWVTYTPFVWLPAVMVLAAFAGHLLIFRALISGAVPPLPRK
jgi:hypothetical protein